MRYLSQFAKDPRLSIVRHQSSPDFITLFCNWPAYYPLIRKICNKEHLKPTKSPYGWSVILPASWLAFKPLKRKVHMSEANRKKASDRMKEIHKRRSLRTHYSTKS